MTQIVVTLDRNADEDLLRRMIENMKGVLKATLNHHSEEAVTPSAVNEDSQWIDKIHELRNSIDPTVIDLNDPRTKYIMSK